MIVLFTSFVNNSLGHGGEKRSAQIEEILLSENFELIYKSDIYAQKIISSNWRKVISIWFALQIEVSVLHFRRLIKIAKDFYIYSQLLNCHPKGVFIWEPESKQDYHIPLIAKRCGWKVIALPQNLESLVPGQYSAKSKRESPTWFEEELSVLSQCDLVVTISREEQWLLRLYGISAEYLPYFPPLQAEISFSKVNRAREKKSNSGDIKKYLLLGTFVNIPTARGMIDLVSQLAYSLNELDTRIEIHVAGYGTENLNGFATLADSIIVHGSVSQSALEHLLIEADAVIAHQPATTGSLTKIPEMLLAGVPVLLNVNAARSWHNCSGVYVYDSIDELTELMCRSLSVGERSLPPSLHIRRFIRNIKKLSGDI